MTDETFVDSHEAAEYLGITRNALRVLVHRKQLTPQGRKNRRSVFAYGDVVALKQKRTKPASV